MQRFILTKELGRLTKWLRILGYDAFYFQKENFSSLFIQALREGRIILTRNNRIPESKGLKIVKIKSEDFKEQIRQLVKELNLVPEKNKMFSRCLLCNSLLLKIAKEKVKEKVPLYVYLNHEEFVECPVCHRIYWSGTHWGNVEKTFREIGL
jgi:hypothetical protein